MVVVVGIAFNLIIIRVHEGVALRGASEDDVNTVPLKFVTQPTTASSAMEVTIARDVEQDPSAHNIDGHKVKMAVDLAAGDGVT